MVSFKKLFTPVNSMDNDQIKSFLEENAEGTYTLLDVRQPGEYERQHIPGSKLLPLGELDKALSEIDPEKPTIVY
jgi:rhodanese-related sulfurtransferase